MLSQYFTRKLIFILYGLFSISLVGCDSSQPPSTYDPDIPKIRVPEPPNTKIMLPDSAIYEGGYAHGLFNGHGRMTWRNGTVYDGEFQDGLFQGKGRMDYADGDVYQGMFLNGMWQGQGTLSMTNGDVYEGEFTNNLFEGNGVYRVKDGDIFEGAFVHGVMSGKGKILFPGRGRYEGEVKDWKMHGKGVYQVEDESDRYVGQFVDDVMQGPGEVFFKSGDYYRGEIRDWRGHGPGEMKKKNGEYYKGNFRYGLYHGEGKITYHNGDTYEGGFENGVRHGKGTLVRAQPRGRKKILAGWWQYGQYSGENKPEEVSSKRKKRNKVDTEKIFYSQQDLLDRALGTLKPGQPGLIELYMLNFAGYGQQEVFMKEVNFAQNLFEKKFATQGHVISLINNHKTVEKQPLASVTNLKKSLQRISQLMNKDEDILFLYLTSHGSSKHVLSISLDQVPLNDLSSTQLAEIIRDSGIKWKVIVVSSCYSGGFIRSLKDQYTMVLTASKADHVSFGCSDEADMTYFGKAFFAQGLQESQDFVQAFDIARKQVARMEDENKYDHSFPQIWTTGKIENQLQQWRQSAPSGLVSDNQF